MLTKLVSSNQTGIHPDSEEVVRKHLASEYRKPVSSYATRTFSELLPVLELNKDQIIF